MCFTKSTCISGFTACLTCERWPIPAADTEFCSTHTHTCATHNRQPAASNNLSRATCTVHLPCARGAASFVGVLLSAPMFQIGERIWSKPIQWLGQTILPSFVYDTLVARPWCYLLHLLDSAASMAFHHVCLTTDLLSLKMPLHLPQTCSDTACPGGGTSSDQQRVEGIRLEIRVLEERLAKPVMGSGFAGDRALGGGREAAERLLGMKGIRTGMARGTKCCHSALQSLQPLLYCLVVHQMLELDVRVRVPFKAVCKFHLLPSRCKCSPNPTKNAMALKTSQHQTDDDKAHMPSINCMGPFGVHMCGRSLQNHPYRSGGMRCPPWQYCPQTATCPQSPPLQEVTGVTATDVQ